MPYRRLPRTDKARLTALRIAIKKGESDGIINPIISLKAQNDANFTLKHYEQSLYEYKDSLSRQKSQSNNSRAQSKTARLYVSHFIQVLNMSILRGEMKKESKTFYGLNPDTNTVPNLTSEKALLNWGDKILKGEAERLRNGGSPIYNPNIAKVKVYYNIFKDSYAEQELSQLNTSRYLESVEKMREKCDEIILDIWNQVELHFEDYPIADKTKACEKYGLVYYYRRGEEKF